MDKRSDVITRKKRNNGQPKISPILVHRHNSAHRGHWQEYGPTVAVVIGCSLLDLRCEAENGQRRYVCIHTTRANEVLNQNGQEQSKISPNVLKVNATSIYSEYGTGSINKMPFKYTNKAH
jgi:hypothetical protein